MELRHLRYFIRAAELLNFTKAAESLYVSQPTLSVQIHQLEDELGTELFARVGRNVRLTESGKVFLARALQAVKELEEGGREIDAIKGLLRGTITIASLPLYGSRLLPSWLSEFNKMHPQVYLRVETGPSDDIEASVLAGSADIGITFVPAQHPDINSRVLFEDEIVLVAAPSHIVATRELLTTDDFQDLPMVLPSARISATKLIGRYFEENNIRPMISMSFDDGHAMLELVKDGKFVTLLPKHCVKDGTGFSLRPLPEPRMKVSTGVVWTNLSPSTKVLLDFISNDAGQLVKLT